MRHMRTRQPDSHERLNGGGDLGPQDLTGLLAAPRWLRDVGATAWLAVGVTLAAVGAVWILSLTQTIVAPLITAAVIAAVTSPAVARLARVGVPRGAAAALLLLGIVVAAVAVVGIVLAGITSQLDALRAHLSDAQDTLASWAGD